jgi:hypothetical protein
MSAEGMPKPYMVAAFYSDGQSSNIGVGVQAALSASNAAAQVVSVYYMQGGKMPLVATHVFEVTREHALAAIAMLDAIDAAEKAEGDRVVKLVPLPQPDYVDEHGQGGQDGRLIPPDGAA